MARQFLSEVVDVEPVKDDSVLLALAVPPGLVSQVRAGQLLAILCRDEGAFDPLLRRFCAIVRADQAASTLTLFVRPSDRAGAWLARRRGGDLLDVLGPVGNAFSIAPRARNLLLVAGGVGAARLLFLAEAAIASRRNVTLLLGAASADNLLPPALVPSAVEYVVATDDGSQGHGGIVTDLVPAYLSWTDQIFAAGPEEMLHALWALVRPHTFGVTSSVQVAIERPMACGTGVCLGCVVDTRRGRKPSCTDGPVFALDEVVW